MNLSTRKPLVAIITTMLGTVTPMSSVFAAGEQPISPDANGTYTPVYVAAEAKENSQEYKNSLNQGFIKTTALFGEMGHLGVLIKTIGGYPVSASKKLSLKITLTGGATFKDRALLICPHSAGAGAVQISAIKLDDCGSGFVLGTNVDKSAYLITPNSDPTGKNVVSFTFAEGFNTRASSGGLCLLTYSGVMTRATGAGAALAATGYDTALLGKGADISMVSEVTYYDLFGAVLSTATIPIVKVVNAFKTETLKVTTGATVVTGYAMIDVKQNSTQFLKADGSTNVYNAFLGQVRVNYADSTVKTVRSVGGSIISAADIFTSARITISGPTIAGVNSITFEKGDSTTCAGGATYLVKATPSAPTTTTSGTSTVSNDASVSVDYGEAFSAIFAPISVGAAKTGLHVCLNSVSGKQMNDGAVTINITGLKGSTEVDLGLGELTTVRKNGTTLRVLNIPGSTNAERAFIRMYNTGNQSFKVSGTLYSDKGEKLTTGETMDLLDGKELQPGDVKAIGAPDLEKMIGNKAWTGRAWLLIQAPISSDFFKVQALLRTPNTSGYLTNSSTDAMD